MKISSHLLLALAASAFAPLTAHAQLVTGFESPFTPGALSGQQGWGVSTSGGVAAANANIVTTSPITGAQSLQLTDQTTTTNGTVTGAFSPVFTPVSGQTITSVDIRIDGVTPGTAGGADYYIAPQSTTEAKILTRVNFNYLGPIRILDKLSATSTTLSYVNTGLNWTPGTKYTVSIITDAAANTLKYQINGVQVYTAVNGLYAATTVNQMVLTSDNFQVAGESATFDNLSITSNPVPEPATMAVLGLGAAALLRRRRKA